MKLLIADGCVDSVNVLSSFLELSGYKIDDACLLETTTGLAWMLTLSKGKKPRAAPCNSLQYPV